MGRKGERGWPWKNRKEEAENPNHEWRGSKWQLGCLPVYWRVRGRWRDLFTSCLPCWAWGYTRGTMFMLFTSIPRVKQHACHTIGAWLILFKEVNIRWINGYLGCKVSYTGRASWANISTMTSDLTLKQKGESGDKEAYAYGTATTQQALYEH